MDELTCSPLNEEEETAEEEVVEATNLERLSYRVLCLQIVAAVGVAIYAWSCGNVLIMEFFLVTGQVWCLILIWFLTLSTVRWRAFVLSGLSVLLTHVLPLQLLTKHSNPDAGRDSVYQEGSWTWHIYTAGVYSVNLTAILAFWGVKCSLRNLYAHQDLGRIILRGLPSLFKVGVFQLSVFTIGVVGVGSNTFVDLVQSAQNYPENSTTFDGLLTAMQAQLAGFAVNVFWVCSLAIRHLLNLSLTDLVHNRVGPLEYLVGILHLMIVVSISIFLTLNHQEVADFLSSRNTSAGNLQLLLVVGYLLPVVLLNLLVFYYSCIQRIGSPKWALFQQRHDRLVAARTKSISHRLHLAEEERQHLYELAAESLRRFKETEDLQRLHTLVTRRRSGEQQRAQMMNATLASSSHSVTV